MPTAFDYLTAFFPMIAQRSTAPQSSSGCPDNKSTLLILVHIVSGLNYLAQKFRAEGYPIFPFRNLSDLGALDVSHFKLIVIIADCPEIRSACCDYLMKVVQPSFTGIFCIGWTDRMPLLKRLQMDARLPGDISCESLLSALKLLSTNAQPKGERDKSISGSGPIQLVLITEDSGKSAHIADIMGNQAEICLQVLVLTKLETLGLSLSIIQPELVILAMADSSPMLPKCLIQIRTLYPHIPILLVFQEINTALTNYIVRFRIAGLISYRIDRETLQKAFQAIRHGELWLPHKVMDRIVLNLAYQQLLAVETNPERQLSETQIADMTKREMDIIRLIVQGSSNKTIAKKLGISPETVKKHLTNIFKKAGLHNRTQLVSSFNLGDFL